MRVSRAFWKTLRDVPGDAEMASHRLLLRAGFIQQVSAGIFSYMPMGWRSLSKIKQIIKEEMDAAGAQEVNMPVVQPRELWERSGRADTYVPPLAAFIDRRERRMVLAPTHEETVTIMARAGLMSYRDLPFNLYHIQTKFRDEPRPRAGLLRGREFEMKDAYSFDADAEGLDRSYRDMVAAYLRIFARCGLDVVMAEADSGPIGGKESTEFIMIADGGEDTVLDCPSCGYAANEEKAVFRKPQPVEEEPAEIEEVSTLGVQTIAQLAAFLSVPESRTIKAVFYSTGSEIVLASIRGDLEVNEVKLRNALGGVELRPATAEELGAAGLVAGSASAVDIQGVRSVVDDGLPGAPNLIAGANRDGYHLRNVNFPRDFKADVIADIALAHPGYDCDRCGTPLRARRGIEAAHVFKLGTIYSSKLGATFIDEQGAERPALMGCYGIGVTRMLAAAVEANHDDAGMVLPRAIAPYEVYMASLNAEDPQVAAAADDLYGQLAADGIEVLFDDRPEPPGVKFNDADLLGLPLRVVVSRRSIQNHQVELKRRKDEKPVMVPVDGVVDALRAALEG